MAETEKKVTIKYVLLGTLQKIPRAWKWQGRKKRKNLMKDISWKASGQKGRPKVGG